ncbi:MAG: hypothetical protein J6031_03270 [Bacteroidales bacterium]|nr:hypothetical protein [Bacteroidales bacterium]
MKTPRSILYFPLAALLILLLASCGKDNRCYVPIGMTNFTIEPNSAYYSGLNVVGGYMYFTGGHRGVIVVRTTYDHFAAYERTCPADSTTAVNISEEYGSAVLECPKCHTLYVVDADGYPMDGGATTCPLYQYSTTYSGGQLWVY